MKKFILINEEVLVRLQEGKYVEGTLHIDKCTGVITFNAWVRKKPKNQKDRVICQLENGWLKESPRRIKFYNSVKKELGAIKVCEVMERELGTATQTLIREKLAEFRVKSVVDIIDEV